MSKFYNQGLRCLTIKWLLFPFYFIQKKLQKKGDLQNKM